MENRWSSPIKVIESSRNGLIIISKLTRLAIPVNLNHFRLLRVVGKGAFGKVRIVERKDTGCTFALKYIRKDEGMSWNTHRPLPLPSCSHPLA
jgi:serine/threonine protein kinase